MVSVINSCNTDTYHEHDKHSIKLKEGDIIFQTCGGSQSSAVIEVTKSKYSHVGIIFQEKGKWFVYEAQSPVRKTSLDSFINGGKLGKYTICRYTEDISKNEIINMKQFYEPYHLSKYDGTFNWSNKRMYCSELVWKMFYSIGIKLSDYELFGQYDLSSDKAQIILNQRFPNGVNLSDTVISPEGLYKSTLLKQIYTNY